MSDGPPDDYERKYMQEGGGSLYHDKITAPLAFHLIFLLPLAIVIVSALVTSAPALVPLLSVIPLVLVWLLFSTLRISVSKRHVHVQYGLFGPKVPIEAILACEAIDYDWKAYGGFGIRFGRDGSVAYNMLGDHGRAAVITYRQGKKERRLLLSSRDPERLALAVNHARAMALPRIEAPAARIEAPAEEAAAQAAAEAEAVAEEAAAQEEARRA